MERQDLNQEQKLQVILCGPLEKTERALLQRGDVEIKRGSSLNLMGEIVNEICDCDMIIVLAPELTAPEDVKACLRELPRPSAPPEALVIAVALCLSPFRGAVQGGAFGSCPVICKR